MENYVAEFVGTLVLILFGVGTVAATALKKSHMNGGGPLFVTTGWGLAVVMGVLVAGWRSGAHINPAVSIAVLVMGKMSTADFVGYVIAQFLGAMAGSILVWLAYKKQFDDEENAGATQIFATGPTVPSYGWNLVTEIIGTAALVFVANVLGNFSDVTGLVPWYVGSLVWVIGIAIGGPTGYAINPARDLGPRFIFSILPIPNKPDANWKYAWVPVVGPLLGGVIGAILVQAYL